jgi:hypothetical protein
MEMEHLYSIAGSNILKLLYRLNKEYGEDYQSIGVGANLLNVRDMEENFYVEAKFEQIDAVVAQQEAQMAMSELERGLIDTETYYKIRRYEDPTTIRKGVLRDMIYKDPAVIEQGVINALREEGFNEMADQRQMALDQQNLDRTMGMAGAEASPQDMSMSPSGAPGQPFVDSPDAIVRQRGPNPEAPMPNTAFGG